MLKANGAGTLQPTPAVLEQMDKPDVDYTEGLSPPSPRVENTQ
jgi:hypothetical protein